MQDEALIPTPLFRRDKPPIRIAPSIAPGPFRWLRILGLALRAAWIGWRPPWPLRLLRRGDPRSGVREIRGLLERLGGIWVKAGQVVAMRRDLFRAETCDELSKLQDQAQGFAWPLARAILEEELGRPIDEVFSSIDPHPIAAASIGQTHEARLRDNGVRVAVKVQRPFVAQSLTRDLRYIHRIVSLLTWLGFAPEARWQEMAWELESALREELDYRVEASAIQRMKKSLREHRIYAPKVFSRYCTGRVLVMEFIEGVFMSEYIQASAGEPETLRRWLAENDVEPSKVGERLLLSHLRQLFEDKIYHGDLHPGNIVLQRKSRIALIDFGTVGTFDESLLQSYHRMFSALAEGDYHKVVDMFLLMAPPLPHGDTAELREELVRVLRAWAARTTVEQLGYHEKSLTALSASFAVVLARHRIPSNWEFLRLNRSDFTMDSSLMFLLPEIDYPALCRKYQRKARARALRRAGGPGAVRRAAGSLAGAAHLPQTIAEKLYFDAEWARKRALGFEGRLGKAARAMGDALSLLSVGLVAAGVLLLAKYLRRAHPGTVSFLSSPSLDRLFDALPDYRPGAWIAVALAAIYLWRKVVHMRSYVTAKEYERAP